MPIVLDYTARIPPAALRAAGVSGVCRYIAPQAWKVINLAEYHELRAAGIDVTLNWESAADDWLGGKAGGAEDGRRAAAMARALGYPPGGVILGSCDINMSRIQWDVAGLAYARAFAAAVRAGGYRPGVYGPWDVLTWVKQAGVMDAFWQAGMSTSWSGGRNRNAWPGAHLRQRGHKTVAGQDTDWNEILIPDWGKPQHQEEVDEDMSWGTDPLMQGTQGYAGQQHDTALAFAWQSAAEAAAGVSRLEAAAAADVDRDNVTLAAVRALVVATGGDPQPILDAIAAAHAETGEVHALVVQLQQQLAQVQARNLKQTQALAAAGVAFEAADD